jgi:coatomer subunit beta'
LRVFNYNTHEKVIAFEAHPDYIRCLIVHPTASIVLTGSDDMTIKAWDWDKQWKNIQVCSVLSFFPIRKFPQAMQIYEGHTHSIMNIAINPKDTNTFASACLDRTVKMWSFAVFHPNLPVIVSGSEDGTVKIWNSNTYRLENTLSYSLERAWCTSLRKDANEVAVGFDEVIVIINVCLYLGPRNVKLIALSSAATNQRSAWIPREDSSTPGTNKLFLAIFK